jgi:hypothetical protein
MEDGKRSGNSYRMGLRGFIWILILALAVQGCPQTEWPPPSPVPVLVEGFELFPDGSPVPPGTEIKEQYQMQNSYLTNASPIWGRRCMVDGLIVCVISLTIHLFFG